MARVSIGACLAAGAGLVARPTALVWYLFQLGASTGLALLMVLLAGPQLSRMMKDPANGMMALALLQQMAIPYILVLLLTVLVYAISAAAANRAILRPEASSLAFLRLGADELRQLVLGLIWGVIGTIVYFATAIVGAIIAGIATVAVRSSEASLFAAFGAIILMMLLFLGVAAPRFGLASAQTFDTGRLNAFGSWTLTRGAYLPMLGLWLATVAIMALLIGASVLITGLTNMALTPTHEFTLNAPADYSSIGAYLSPRLIIRLTLGAGLLTLFWPLTLAPFAAAYRSLAPNRDNAAEVFA